MNEVAVQNNAKANNAAEQSKVVSLFKFIKELNALKQKNVLNIAEYPWSRTIQSLPNDPDNISVFYRDRIESEEHVSDCDFTLLSVHKPEFEKCPPPDTIFSDWLEDGWYSFQNDVAVIEKKELEAPAEQPETEIQKQYESFTDNEDRIAAFDAWINARSIWVNRQKLLARTRSLFSDLYRLFFELQRDSETMELVVANGMLCDRQNASIKHPALTKRVKMRYDATANTIYIDDADTSPELYLIAFQIIEDINLDAINQLQEDLQKNDYHPFDRNDTPDFLKILVHQLSSDGKFSENGIPEKWTSSSRLLLYMEPCFIMRKRLDGTLKAIEQIIENVQETGYIPAPIREIVSGGKVELPEDKSEESIEEQLAAVGGESADVFLSKEANKEQLEIAKRIELYNAVLVQGPPGTGKTHTIANLLGHFLAQGKSVLVTSQTPKALSVLKDKVALGLQSLCVSVLEDSNVDMERSIDGITNYMSRTNSHELSKKMDVLSAERRKLICDLAEIRRKIFCIIHQECNCIVYNRDEISPSKAAQFVVERANELSYIPGKVRTDMPLPLTFSELITLYQSNEAITTSDESELAANIPAPSEILDADAFSEQCNAFHVAQHKIKTVNDSNNPWCAVIDAKARQIAFDDGNRKFSIDYPANSAVGCLSQYAEDFRGIDDWMIYAAVDGKNGGAFRNRWEILIQKINETCEYAESILKEQFGKTVTFTENTNQESIIAPFRKLQSIFKKKGKLSKFTLAFNKDCASALECAQINGKTVDSAADCQIVLHTIELNQLRDQCAAYWKELLSYPGVPTFADLSSTTPERIALNWVPNITKFLNWYERDFADLSKRLLAVGITPKCLFASNALDSDFDSMGKMLKSVSTDIPVICDVCRAAIDLHQCEQAFCRNRQALQEGARRNSNMCHTLALANDSMDVTQYRNIFITLSRLYEKYALLKKRRELLVRIEPIAPQWAAAIRGREGIHGVAVPPDTIKEAWKWKQLSAIIEEMTSQPFGELQKESISLEKKYRRITAEYAEASAWYHLLHKTEGDRDAQQALQGWKQTVKKIGKGTGKNAPMLKAKARELMSVCQNSVPAWIMPINRALYSLNPKENRFDIVIIDEASQSDVSSLAILYMGKKLIIVGDDKQVSPTAVGVEIGKMNALQQMYIQDKIPNSHLYDAKTSIYDIAKTTFQPLMLREHFRCVPDIIGFSNMLSYNYEIKPLRAAGDCTILPAVVNYRVADGKRLDNKTNPAEAKTIVALIKACIEQPEYAGKTFGVISLLGDEQVRVIQRLIEEEIGHKELIERNILCGNASHFQGDERDIIFLSVVDSSDGSGPIKMQNFGIDDAFRKRYNVAASRARDQLWVVDSLDASSDLKSGDIRKILIDYSINPAALENKHAEIEEKPESPFEVAVAKALSDHGYHLVQQWPVGAYRLDMVAVYGKKTVAIECDGERYHSGEAKIRKDMERQIILERLGWRFIRIRGSEYFRNPDKTMERVFNELIAFGVEPESDDSTVTSQTDTDLLSRIKLRAAELLAEKQTATNADTDIEIIAAAVPSDMSTLKQTERNQVEVTRSKQISVTGDSKRVNSKGLGNSVSPSKAAETTVRRKIASKSNDNAEIEQLVLPCLEEHSSDLIGCIKNAGIRYVDKRSMGGSLWIIGGKELAGFVSECKAKGIRFTFKSDGGKATKGKPGWWTK